MEDKLKGLLGPGSKYKKILFVGVGNVLRNDDGVGVYIGARIKNTPPVFSLNVENSLERHVGKINNLDPDLLVLVDCVHFGQAPGSWDLLPVDRVKDFTLHTHNVSLKRITEFFEMEVLVLGIQPRDVSIGEELSPPVRETADRIVAVINQV